MCFPAVFLLSEFLLAEKDLKPSRFSLPKQGGKEGGKEAVYGDAIATESESPSAQQTLFFPGLKTEQDVLQGVQLFSFVAFSSLQTFVMYFSFCEIYQNHWWLSHQGFPKPTEVFSLVKKLGDVISQIVLIKE